MTCPRCDGLGYVRVHAGFVPYGSANVSLPDEQEPCPRCNPEGLDCPECSAPLSNDVCIGCGLKMVADMEEKNAV